MHYFVNKERLPGRKAPCRKTIKKIVQKVRKTVSVGNDNKDHSGQYVTVRTHANVQTVWKYLYC